MKKYKVSIEQNMDIEELNDLLRWWFAKKTISNEDDFDIKYLFSRDYSKVLTIKPI